MFRYKTNFVTAVLLFSYTFLHLKLTGVFTEATFEQYINFAVRLPYGQRLLIPAIAHGLATILPISTGEIFFLLEWLSNCLVFYAIYYLLLREFSPKQAKLLSWLFIVLLPLISAVNYRYPLSGEAPFYFPNDSAALFFVAAGMLLCLKERWYLFTAVVCLATFNRESSILLVLFIPALHWARLKEVIKPLLCSMLIYILTRLIIVMLLQNLHGQWIELYYLNTLEAHFEVNLLRLLYYQQIFLFPFCFACIPIFWFAFYDYIPQRYQPLKYIALLYFLGLLLVGNFIESRIFGEIVIMLYLPVCAGIYRWLTDREENNYANLGKIAFYVDRYAIVTTFALIILFKCPLTKLLLWLTHP